MYYIGFDKNKPKCYHLTVGADMVELADTPDLGSGARACRFKSCQAHEARKRQYIRTEETMPACFGKRSQM